MYKVKKSVDLNAYITNFNCKIKSDDGNKQLEISFDNLGRGTIVAIRFEIYAKDSFGDTVKFDGKDILEIKKADLNVKPQKRAGFVYDIKNYDIKETDYKLTQIVYSDGKIVVPESSDNVEYEIDVLSSSWSSEDHFEKDALDYMREINPKAICFPTTHPRGWICVCGNLNREDMTSCNVCGALKEKVFKTFLQENVRTEIIKKEKREQEEAEKRLEQQRKEQKKQKRIVCIIIGVIVAIVIGFIGAIIYHNTIYGLSDEEAVAYKIAQNNYKNIELLVLVLSNKYCDIVESYDDDIFNSGSNLSEAEKDRDYLYARGIYIASPLLFDLIKEQYPSKYHKVYTQLTKLQKGKVYNRYLSEEELYIKENYGTSYIDNYDVINDAIDKVEKYMQNEKLNPNKVEIENIDLPTPDYSKVYGINLGIIFADDGSISYVGEFSNGKANGFGRFNYTNSRGDSDFCLGTFSDGIFVEDEEGNKIDGVPEVTGEVVLVKELTNTPSIESVANKATEDEKRATEECKRYLQATMNKHKSIKNIEWDAYPTVSGRYFYFSCTVEEYGVSREGEVTVVKQSDGTFMATGLAFKD